MAKKKKSQLKPVERGFSTTSVPKKPTATDVNTTSQSGDDIEATLQAGNENDIGGAGAPESRRDASNSRVLDDLVDDDVRAEEQFLQNFIDKFQEKTEKEITRTIKAIEFDRRFARSFLRVDLDPAYQERIFQLIVDGQEGSKVIVDEPIDKVLPRLGITYGILRRLGFHEERVLECLRSIHGVDLDEAFEWLYIHCPPEELEHAEEPQKLRTPRTPAAGPTFIVSSSNHQPDSQNSEILAPSNVESESHGRESEHLPAYGPGSISPRSSSSSDDDADDDDDDDDPNLKYAKLKLRIAGLEHAERRDNHSSDDNSTLLASLRSRLETIRSHYFFRAREAEELYRLEKTVADQRALEQRLMGGIEDVHVQPINTSNQSSSHTPRTQEQSSLHTQTTQEQVETVLEDIFDEDGSPDGSGGIFGTLLDSMPESEITDGVQVHIRNMAFPKHWAGRTPKALLLETVQKADRYAIVSYCILPDARTSRAKRGSVVIRWQGAKTREWSMDGVGCWDEAQAEHYVSTVALHDLTFGQSEGFAGGGSSTGIGQTSFRLLPPVFRDLWDELELKRKESEERRNKEAWAVLRWIVVFKLGGEKRDSIKSNKAVSSQSQVNVPRPATSGIVDTEELKSRFLTRRASPAYQQMLALRNKLPISQYRDEIIVTLERSQVMVLSGETGCGKSTQLPAYILEDALSKSKYCKICCTEPRRISAISLAQRVSVELGDPPGSVGTLGSLVGYTVRLESNTTRNTRLAYVTNGIALRMLEGGNGNGGQGMAFDEITHIIIDEVHERSLDSDFILIVLKTLIEHRKDLKVILMSATVDAQKISDFFGGCPILHVPGRTFPVDVRFLEDSIEYSGWTIKEGSPYAKRLDDRYYRNNKTKVDWNEEDVVDMDDDDDTAISQEIKLEKRYSQATKATVELLDERIMPYDLIVRLLERLCFEDASSIQYSAAILIFMPGLAEIRRLNETLSEHPLFGVVAGFRIFPLHSTLSSESQTAVFDLPPPGVRKIVIATNIAETGVTIPDITCVIDTGKHREMRFDEKRQISRLIETFIAKSNAVQRRGRAGRVQPGICFHLFTRARHDQQMAENPLPEMLRLSLSDLALRIKILKVKIGTSIEDALSRALDPPSQLNVQRAVQALVEVKALTPNQDITPMGRLLSKLPTDVHLGKFLLVAAIFGCLDPALTIAAALNSKSPFVTPLGLEQEADRSRRSFQSENSDFLTIHNAFASWRRASSNTGFVKKFCRHNFLSHQNLQQIEELRQQFLGYLIDSGFIQVSKAYITELSRARYSRHKTRFVNVPNEFDRNSNDNSLINAALIAGLYPKVLVVDEPNGQLRTITNNQLVSFHPSSVNFGKKLSEFAMNFLSYFTIMQSKKLYAWETGPIDNMALLLLCGDCDVKLASETLVLDRKIKFRLGAKSCVALKHLREQFTIILALKMRRMPLTEVQERWYTLALTVLGQNPNETLPNTITTPLLVSPTT